MARVKRRTFSGAVCEQEVFTISDRVTDVKNAVPPPPRFKTLEERERHRIGVSRRHHARVVNANFNPQSLYSTLTIDNEHEVHTFDEARRVRDLYVRRLKYAFPDARISIYMGRGKSTFRIHMHMISHGVPEEVIKAKWTAGSVLRIEPMRAHNYYDGVDRGQDYTGLANYLFDHWTPEQGGHRWKQTKNMLQPETEPATVVKRTYSEQRPPLAPKGYKLVESRGNSFGYLYYKYVQIVDKPQRRKGKKASMLC